MAWTEDMRKALEQAEAKVADLRQLLSNTKMYLSFPRYTSQDKRLTSHKRMEESDEKGCTTKKQNIQAALQQAAASINRMAAQHQAQLTHFSNR